jgi:hypothetical protein
MPRPQHSAKKAHLGTGKTSLLSVVATTLDKEATFAECLLVRSAKVLTEGPTGVLIVEC